MVIYAIYRKHDKQAKKQKLPEFASPIKQEIVEIQSIPNKTEDVIPPHEEPLEIEVVIGNKDNTIVGGDDEEVVGDLYGPPQGPAVCSVDAEKISGGPAGPASVQLVQCAV